MVNRVHVRVSLAGRKLEMINRCRHTKRVDKFCCTFLSQQHFLRCTTFCTQLILPNAVFHFCCYDKRSFTSLIKIDLEYTRRFLMWRSLNSKNKFTLIESLFYTILESFQIFSFRIFLWLPSSLGMNFTFASTTGEKKITVCSITEKSRKFIAELFLWCHTK